MKVTLILVMLSLGVAYGELTVAPLFTDGGVLQRNQPVPVWGTASAGQSITVSFANQRFETKADSSGKWMVHIGPLEASSEGRELIVEGGGRIELTDIVVGEVWLCSGQSNMEWPLKRTPDAETLISASDYPLIRQFKVKNIALSDPATTANGSWISCSPETAGDFTALGYFFARALQQELNVPIGLINSSWGGTRIESWMSGDSLKKFPDVAESWEVRLRNLPARQIEYEKARLAYREEARAAKAAGKSFNKRWPQPPPGPGTKWEPSGNFNGMIAPLIPYAIRGVLWYQGEGNSGNAGSYAEYLPELITDWRARWMAPELPFYVVQLPNYRLPTDPDGERWAAFREAQESALELPATAVIVTIDIGTPDDGHPPDKTEYGERLARFAKINLYGVAYGDATGPRVESIEREGDFLRIRFSEISSGLALRGEELTGFEIADSDLEFVSAPAKIDGDTVLVSTSDLPEPVFVRYAWSNDPSASLYNGAGLPAAPFRRLLR